MKMTLNIKKITLLTLWSGVYLVRKSLPIEALIGGANFVVITPLLGSFLSLPQTGCILGMLTLIKFGLGALPITLGLPTMLATLSWSTRLRSRGYVGQAINKKSSLFFRLGDAFLHLVLPMVCIAIFVTHPVGRHAWPYATYWTIPMMMWAVRNIAGWSGSFWIALQSTFIAHALGSIMYLFTVPMTASMWLTLIPVVAVERLTMASTTCFLYESSRMILASIKRPLQSMATRLTTA